MEDMDRVTKAKPCQPGAGEGVVGEVESHKLKLKTAVHANCTMDNNLKALKRVLWHAEAD